MNPHRISVVSLFFCALCLLAHPAQVCAWVSPVTRTSSPGVVRRAFEPTEHNWLSGHRGVDLEAHPGTPIYASGTGVVAFAGVVAGSPTVSIDHDEPVASTGNNRATELFNLDPMTRIRTTYQPVIAQVKQGQRIHEGQLIGHVGGQPAAHHHAASGLHWGARILPTDDHYINPLFLLPTPVIRLKPFHAATPAGAP
ncbi:M23 family metallopeptidase [Corynebacterium sp. zg-331]|uniref:M23 family metallopeptidase n=1 Tax=unclassified Corynebacterium TaxID=2624378 RepID=UPI00128CAADF|nr:MULTISPECIES: M23 family metallopeptidase [unclassified Corynebacterium]MBC3185320.1 M23 family metallopeptidase [Corynebacterium sp. zg-331]MPV51817.1 peptidoglycan DD-metalloendopeptidase family protein [Corynebacterium sp. zg331]